MNNFSFIRLVNFCFMQIIFVLNQMFSVNLVFTRVGKPDKSDCVLPDRKWWTNIRTDYWRLASRWWTKHNEAQCQYWPNPVDQRRTSESFSVWKWHGTWQVASILLTSKKNMEFMFQVTKFVNWDLLRVSFQYSVESSADRCHQRAPGEVKFWRKKNGRCRELSDHFTSNFEFWEIVDLLD